MLAYGCVLDARSSAPFGACRKLKILSSLSHSVTKLRHSNRTCVYVKLPSRISIAFNATPSDGQGASDDKPLLSSIQNAIIDFGMDLLGQSLVLTPAERRKLDCAPDSEFYATPRMQHHTDEACRQQLTNLYSQLLLPGSCVLDLCSSFSSHLPPPEALPLAQVVGQGMSEGELQANTRLTQRLVQDLNMRCRLPLPDSCLDAVVCCCGIMYLTHPEAVLAEVQRLLKPGGQVLFSFSSHCYPDKAVAGWLERDEEGRLELVRRLFEAAGLQQVQVIARRPSKGTIHGGVATTSNPASSTVVLEGSLTGQPTASGAAGPSAEGLGHSGPGHDTTTSTTTSASALPPLPASRHADPFYAVLGFKRSQEEGVRPVLDASTLVQQYTAPALLEMDMFRDTMPTLGRDVAPGSSPGQGSSYQTLSAKVGSPAAARSSSVNQAGSTGGTGALGEVQITTQPTTNQPAGSTSSQGVSRHTLECWAAAYAAMASDAMSLGIPQEAIPDLPDQPSEDQIRQARDHLQAMIASFLSSGL